MWKGGMSTHALPCAGVAADHVQKEKLEELCSPEGVDLLYDYCIREKKTYAEVLVDFPSVKVPLPILLQLIPRQQPRSYSISSSALAHPGRVRHFCRFDGDILCGLSSLISTNHPRRCT